MPFVSVNGIDLHYTTIGDGPPLLLIAGFASDGASWAPVITPLSQSFRLIIPDNRACGQTRADGAPISLNHYAEDCIALMDHLGLRSAHVLGHSMGGAIAMTLAANWPSRVNKLMIAASAPTILERSRTVIDSLTALREAGTPEEAWFRQFFAWLFAPKIFDDPRAVDAAIAMAMRYPHRQSITDMRRQANAMRGVDLHAEVAKISVKTLVLAGAHDLLYPPHLIREGFNDRASFQIKIMEDAAHSVHWDAPDAFIDAVSGFLGTD